MHAHMPLCACGGFSPPTLWTESTWSGLEASFLLSQLSLAQGDLIIFVKNKNLAHSKFCVCPCRLDFTYYP